MILINEGISEKLLDTVATGTQNSDAFSLPTKATQLTWQTSFGVAPASITVQLQTSLDNSLWSTIDTSTSVAGEDRTIATSALFIRARINAISGGSAITVQLVCKTGFIGLTTPSSVTDGALVLFDGTTGSKLKELLFPGGTTTFLRADGTFASAGGGGGGTPASPVNSIQFNNAGSFGGDANLTWTPSVGFQSFLAVAIGNDGNTPGIDSDGDFAFSQLNQSQTFTNQFATGNVASFAIDAYIRPDANYGSRTFVGLNLLSLGEFSSPHTISAWQAMNVFAHSNSTIVSNEVTAITADAGGVTGGKFQGIVAAAGCTGIGVAAATGYLIGVTSNPSGTGLFGGSVAISSYSAGFYTAGNYTGVTTPQIFDYYAGAPVVTGSTITESYAFWAGDRAGSASKMYYSWFDSNGVRRVKEDNTFNSVGQAIEALYNPQFAKYTPEAVDYERIVQQWESNVAVIRTEKGGSGTLRDINIAGAHFRVNNNIGIAASVTTAALVGKTMTFVDGILTGFA